MNHKTPHRFSSLTPSPPPSSPLRNPQVGPPPDQAFHHATTVPGYFLVPANLTQASGNSVMDLYIFNLATNVWSNPFAYIPFPQYSNGFPAIPFLFANGGTAVLVNEQDPFTLSTIDATAANNAEYATIYLNSNSVTMQGRVGQRFINFGSTLFMFGGWNPTQGVMYNDMFALDLTFAIAAAYLAPGQAVASWTQVSPLADPTTSITPGYPSPRMGFSWTDMHVGAAMYGGVSRTTPGASPLDCFAWRRPGWGGAPVPSPPTDCIFHHHVFRLLPGLGSGLNGPDPSPAPYMPATAWTELNSFTGVNGQVPQPRALHTAGLMGDQLYIYGGVTAAGPVQEMWVYNLVAESWASVTSSGPTPLGFGVGCVIGRYVFTERIHKCTQSTRLKAHTLTHTRACARAQTSWSCFLTYTPHLHFPFLTTGASTGTTMPLIMHQSGLVVSSGPGHHPHSHQGLPLTVAVATTRPLPLVTPPESSLESSLA